MRTKEREEVEENDRLKEKEMKSSKQTPEHGLERHISVRQGKTSIKQRNPGLVGRRERGKLSLQQMSGDRKSGRNN